MDDQIGELGALLAVETVNGSRRSARVGIALGGSLIVQPGGTAFSLRALLSFLGLLFALFRRLRVRGRNFALGLCIFMVDLGAPL